MTDKALITISGTILVNKNQETVFNFFANPINDKFWRAEINESTLNNALQLGVMVSEYSYLSKKAPKNLVQLECVQYTPNETAIFETPNNSPFYERSERQVKSITINTTEVTYTLIFDKGIVKLALGFSLPRFIISLKAKSDLKKYLQQLKSVLERN